MNKSIVAIALFVVFLMQFSCVEEKNSSIKDNEDKPKIISSKPDSLIFDNPVFEVYANKFMKINDLPFFLEYNCFGVLKSIPDLKSKILSVKDIELFLGLEEKGEFIKRNEKYNDRLVYYYGYMLPNMGKNVISILVLKDAMDIETSFLMINYDNKGNILSKTKIAVDHQNMGDPKDIQSSVCSVIKINGELTLKTKFYLKDSVKIKVENKKITTDGTLSIIDEKSEFRKYNEELDGPNNNDCFNTKKKKE